MKKYEKIDVSNLRHLHQEDKLKAYEALLKFLETKLIKEKKTLVITIQEENKVRALWSYKYCIDSPEDILYFSKKNPVVFQYQDVEALISDTFFDSEKCLIEWKDRVSFFNVKDEDDEDELGNTLIFDLWEVGKLDYPFLSIKSLALRLASMFLFKNAEIENDYLKDLEKCFFLSSEIQPVEEFIGNVWTSEYFNSEIVGRILKEGTLV